jgi:hypothetical protein
VGEGRGDDRDAVPSRASFERASRASLEESVKGRVEEDPPLVARLAEHFGEDPRGLPIISEQDSASQRAGGLRGPYSGERRSSELAGVAAEQKRYAGLSPSDLVAPAGGACRQRLLACYAPAST